MAYGFISTNEDCWQRINHCCLFHQIESMGCRDHDDIPHDNRCRETCDCSDMTNLNLLMRDWSPAPSGKGIGRGSQKTVSSQSPGLNKKIRSWQLNGQGVVAIELNNIQRD